MIFKFQDVCAAIAETAFKTSPYPVLLSIENHLCKQQQKQMVTIFREVFGSKLLVQPLKTHPVISDGSTCIIRCVNEQCHFRVSTLLIIPCRVKSLAGGKPSPAVAPRTEAQNSCESKTAV